jgi:hypothetical protein
MTAQTAEIEQDVPPEKFVDAVKEHEADVVAQEAEMRCDRRWKTGVNSNHEGTGIHGIH